MPLPLFLCVCVSVFFTPLNLGQHPQASGRLGQGENSFWRFPPSQQHMDTCLHSTSPIIPHSTPSSIKPPHPSYLHHLTLEEGSKHGCNYNQTHTLCSVTHRPSLSARVPAHRRLHSFSGCPRLISSCSILKTQRHAHIHPCLILPPSSGPAEWSRGVGF